MPISFTNIPTTNRLPFAYAEFDASQAQQGPALLTYKALLIGQKTSAGSATANTLVRVTSAAAAIPYVGRGSMLHRMAVAWFASNKATELWLGVLADDGAGVAANGTITVTGPATAAGTIYLYIGGQRITIAVASGAVQNDIATAINAAINAATDLPVTSTVATNVVTVTFRHKGLSGNGLDMRVNYRTGEALPTGVSLAFVALASGTTSPSLTNLIAAMGDTWFHVIAHPYTDSTNLGALETEMASRFAAPRMIDGVIVTSLAGTHSALTTLGAARNSPSSVIAAQPGESPLTPAFEFAAEYAALIAYYGSQDPARPFQTLPMVNALPPADTDLFTNAERNLQLFDGIATSRVVSGQVQMERAITTYQTSSSGADDTAYLDVTTPLTLMYLRYSWRTRMLTKYPRHKLANDGARIGAGQAVITPKVGEAEALAWFRQMEELGLVEGYDQFKRDLIVERNTTDPNRLDFLLPADVINQLVVNATVFQFRL
jgi:phage tail sheath gpL-like